MKANPDNRKDNAAKIKKNIDLTRNNIEAANEMINRSDNQRTKEELRAKNERREEAIKGMNKEFKDETDAQ